LLLTNDKTIIDIKNDSELIGFITKVNQNTYYLEITLDQIDKFDINTSSKIATSIPFEHKQDINLTLNKDILFHELLLLVKTIQKEIDQKINISMEFLEEYTNESLKTLNKKAYLISLKFQSLENSISKEDIKPIREKILTELKNQLDIDLKQ